jgi:hypothetical protein
MLFLLASATLLAACGGASPAGPSAAGGVLLEGTMLGGASALPFRASAGSSAAAVDIVVSCTENPAITAVVGPGGSFTLRGLPAGGFELVFTQGGAPLGILTFSEVKPNQEITITVALNGTTLTLVEQKRNGIGHGDLEIEGLVQQLLCAVTGAPACTTAGDSRFLIDGRTVVARPGQTAIREGNTARTVNDVTVGRRVHVKGTWLPAEGATQPVLASEIKLQDDGDGTQSLSCAAGAKAEVEGTISTIAAPVVTVAQQGKGLYSCTVGAGTPIRKGNKTYVFADLKTGWRVHVKGTAQGFGATGACNVTASEVMVQQD